MARRAKEEYPFAKILRAVMTERQVSARQAAKIAGVSHSTIIDWQTGSSPDNYLAVKKLSEALGVSFSYLLTGKHDDEVNGVAPPVTTVFADGDTVFDGYAKITIQKLVPRAEIKFAKGKI